MKKLLAIIVIIALPLIAFFQFKNYQRFHPPVKYEYEISDEIDPYYHDQGILDEFYSKAIEIGAFARLQWRSSGLDVRFPDEQNLAEVNAATYYNQLRARVGVLEARLKASQALKKEGFDNAAIRWIEEGYPKAYVQWASQKKDILSIQFGEQSQFVWTVQKRLIEEGHDHTLDGLFGLDTQNAIQSFQNKHGLYPSGTITEETFRQLFF